MRRMRSAFGALILGGFIHSVAAAQVTTPPPPPATASAEVTACAQAQKVADSMLADAYARLEMARQSNNPAEMRAAIDALQTTIRDVRAQLVACANVGGADPHAGHAMPKPPAPAKPPGHQY